MCETGRIENNDQAVPLVADPPTSNLLTKWISERLGMTLDGQKKVPMQTYVYVIVIVLDH